jgi:hypothetical protein
VAQPVLSSSTSPSRPERGDAFPKPGFRLPRRVDLGQPPLNVRIDVGLPGAI